MDALLLKAPDGRIVTCPRHLTTTEVVDENPITTINPAALKAGWSIATAADLAALAKRGK